jgi:hypothetical protein
MSSLPRPELPPGAQRNLNDALHELHHHAGWPSLRTLAGRAGCSHTTVSKVFSAPAVPTWGVLEVVVEAMDGDAGHFRALWLAATRPSQSAAASPRLVGRRRELAAVERHLSIGTGLLLVAGEAGIGKTRLVDVATANATTKTATNGTESDVAVVHASGLPLLADEPFAVIAEVLRHIYAFEDGQWFKDALADCSAFVGPSLSRVLPDLEDAYPVEVDDRMSISRLFAAVTASLRALAALRRFALVLDDLHWADSATLTCLDRLPEEPPLPVVGTFRPGEVPEADTWFSRTRLHAADCLELAPLTAEETAEQIAVVTGRPVQTSAAKRIYALSGGLPLFTEELARTRPEEPLPTRLLDSLVRPLGSLGRHAHRVVAVAAVADRALPAHIVGEAVDLDAPALTEALRELDRSQLLATPYGVDVALRHPLLAAAVRAHLVPGEAASAHAALATVLGAAADASAAEVAEHWKAAGNAHEEMRWRVAAGRTACRRLAPAEEARHWQRLLELWPQGRDTPTDRGITREELLVEAVHALIGAGRMDEGRPLADEALALAPSMEPALRAVALRRASQVVNHTDPLAAVSLAQQAIEAYEDVHDTEGVVQAMSDQSCALRTAGSYSEAEKVVAEMVRVSADLGPQTRRGVLIEHAWLEVAAGRTASGLSLAEEAASIEVAGDPFGDVWVGTYHTDLLLMTGASSRVVEAAARPALASARAADIESFILSTMVLGNVVEALLRDGHIARASALIDAATSEAPRFTTRFLHLLRARAEVARGELDQAAHRLDDIAAFEFDAPSHRLALVENQAYHLLWANRHADAWAALADMFSHEQPVSWSAYTGASLALAARAAADLAANDPSQAPTLLTSLREMRSRIAQDPFAPSAPVGARSATAATWTAELDRLTGRDSVEGWGRAAIGWERLGFAPDAGYCRWRAAQVALRDGQGTAAQRLLARASRDAHEHVPLTEAITATAGRARDRELCAPERA